MRIDWNPAEAGYYATQEILDLLSRYVPGLMAAWPHAMITRVDVTFDVTGLSIQEVYVFTKSLKTKQTPFHENCGRLNAVYLGVPKSAGRLALYDKRHEQLGKGVRFAPPRAAGHPPYLPRPRTRFEFRFLRIGTIGDIPSFANGLSRYFVALAYKARRHNGGRLWEVFIGKCDRLCAQEAFHFVADRKRRAYYRRLMEKYCTPDWYCHRTLWQEAKESMTRALWIEWPCFH